MFVDNLVSSVKDWHLVRKARKPFPENGAAYEQFNLTVLFATIIVCNYVLVAPQPTTQEALFWLLGDVSLTFWRYFLGICALVALFSSTCERYRRLGLAVLTFAAFTWSAVLFVGFAGEPKPQIFGSAVIYGAFARQAFYIARFGGGIKNATKEDPCQT